MLLADSKSIHWKSCTNCQHTKESSGLVEKHYSPIDFEETADSIDKHDNAMH